MNKKRATVILCLIALAASALAFGKPFGRQGQNTLSQQSQGIPDHVVYKYLFHHLAALKRHADEVEQQGEDGSPFRSLYKRKANLSEDQARMLDEIATDCNREVAQQDARAKVLIDAYKAQYPEGKVPHGALPLPPPAELEPMQKERNVMFLRARDRLHEAFGDQEFKLFDDFVKGKIKSNIKPLTPEQIQPIPN